MIKHALIAWLSRVLQLLEDLGDLAIVFIRRNEPTIPHEQVVSELKAEGILPDNWKGSIRK